MRSIEIQPQGGDEILPDQALGFQEKLDQLWKIGAQNFADLANGSVTPKDARKVTNLIGRQLKIMAGKRQSKAIT